MIEFLMFISSTIVSIVLLRYEFRKTRELEVFYSVYENLVKIIEDVESHIKDVRSCLFLVYVSVQAAEHEGNANGLTSEPFNDDLEEFLELELSLNQILNATIEIKKNLSRIDRLKINFIAEESSWNALESLKNSINKELLSTVGNSYSIIKNTIETKVLVYSEYRNIIKTEKSPFENMLAKDFKANNPIQEVDTVLAYFNKNKIK